jgi:hypothetical protein
VIDASSPRSPEASPQAVGVLDPAWRTSTPQTIVLMPVPAASIPAIELALVDLGSAPPHRSHSRTI